MTRKLLHSFTNKLSVFISLSYGLAACAHPPAADLQQLLPSLRWQLQTLHVSGLPLRAAVRQTAPAAPWHVYIEGDGFAFLSRTRPSLNPSPRGFSALQLALKDDAPNVAYLGRPCQWLQKDEGAPACTPAVWTRQRFTPEMAERMNQAYRRLVPQNADVTLIAYSGGAAHALHLARHNPNVSRLLTVAGNLNPDATNAHHHVTRQSADINPLSGPSRLDNLPQRHLVGESDKVIPPALANSQLISPRLTCAKIEAYPATHHQGWAEKWPGLLNQPFPCHTEPPV